MKVFLHTIHEVTGYNPNEFKREFASFLCLADSNYITLSTDAGTADVILVIDMHMGSPLNSYRKLIGSELYRRYGQITCVYDESDRPMLFGRGLYVSMPKLFFNETKHVAVPYWSTPTRVFGKGNAGYSKQCLVSFRGDCRTHRCRSLLKTLSFDGYSFSDTSDKSHSVDGLWTLSYIDLILSSQYSLCPRGNGTSSFRLFESLILGVCPIIVSDQFVIPAMLNHYDYRRIAEREICIDRMNQVTSQSAPKNKPIDETDYATHFAIAIRDGISSKAKLNLSLCHLSRVLWRLLRGKL